MIPAPVATDCIDLATALGQAGVENPTIGLAQEAVRASLAEQMEARALLIPSLDAGVSYDVHRGNLQSAQGSIIDVNRQSLYGGAGAAAVGAGTVGFPGVHLFADLGDAVFEPRIAGERVAATGFDAAATQNAVLLDVTGRYLALVEAEAHVKAIRQSEADFQQVAELTADFAHTGQGRQSDSDRAKADSLLLHTTEQQAEEEEAVASAELARLLNRDPSAALHTPGGPVPMIPLVDPRLDLESLVRIALDNRPEMAARAADVALNQRGCGRSGSGRCCPCCPSATPPASSAAAPIRPTPASAISAAAPTSTPTPSGRWRTWASATGARRAAAVPRWTQAQSERFRTIDRIRRETAYAYAAAAASLREVETAGRRVATAQRAFKEDLTRGPEPGGVADRSSQQPPVSELGPPGPDSRPRRIR